MSNSGNLHILVLAAGAASRFGSPKQLARIGGQTLLQKAVSQATAVCGQAVTVVLGAHAEQITPMLRNSGASVEINRHWQEGLASSLRLGIQRLPGSCEGVLVTLADQATISTHDLLRLRDAWIQQPEWLVAALYDGHTGVPAVFPSWCFRDFATLRGDAGARSILARHADRCLRIPMPQAAVDIDRPEDLQALETRENQPPG